MTESEIAHELRCVTASFYPTPFGEACVGSVDGGICHISFVGDHDREHVLASLKQEWGEDKVVEGAPQKDVADLFTTSDFSGSQVELMLIGTEFQIKVWQQLLTIPMGETVSYHDIAKAIGLPKGARAVGTAVGANPIAYLVPCHRVVRSTGALGGYRYGTKRKNEILKWEAKQAQA